MSVAVALQLDGDKIRDARIVLGAVACVPHRLKAVEQAIIGSPRNEDTAKKAAAMAAAGAHPLAFNQFKIPLLENLVLRAIRGA